MNFKRAARNGQNKAKPFEATCCCCCSGKMTKIDVDIASTVAFASVVVVVVADFVV